MKEDNRLWKSVIEARWGGNSEEGDEKRDETTWVGTFKDDYDGLTKSMTASLGELVGVIKLGFGWMSG